MVDYREKWVTQAKELLARQWRMHDKTGLPMHDYMDDDEHRRALATVLKTGNPPQEICDLLAAMFDPDGDSERRIEFKNRDKKLYTNHWRNSEIVARVREKRNELPSDRQAIAAVAEEINMSFDNVKSLWRDYKAFRDADLI